ncbi:hypothetical protein WMY93_032673 [Mugilogobius chulae]|uniref:Alpha-ketoglutarate-dependent dioxygenase AlkB-like domain-containing protein n=1 Tax=Mugilogobius chulae TaxID=88201 RepID=A0AAW0MK40_9GOBI
MARTQNGVVPLGLILVFQNRVCENERQTSESQSARLVGTTEAQSQTSSSRSSSRADSQRAPWATGQQRNTAEEKSFEFQRPEQRLRQIPPERIIHSSGDYEISSEPSGVSRLRLIHNFLSTEEADWTFSKLLNELPWSQKTNVRLGEAYEEPRLTCWFGDLPYTYSNSTIRENTQWPSELLSLRSRLLQSFGLSLNSVLCNLYRSGHDSIGWHSDDEEENGDFTFSPHVKVPLSHGSLLIMEGSTQDDWQVTANQRAARV